METNAEKIDGKLKRSELRKNRLVFWGPLIGAVWALWVFYFEQIFMPGKDPAYVVVTSSHQIEGEKDSFYILRSTIRIQNLSKVKVNLIASSFNITRLQISPTRFTDSAYSAYSKEYINKYQALHRFEDSNVAVVNGGRLIPDMYWLGSQEEVSRNIISLVPKKSCDAIRFFAEVIASKDIKEGLLLTKWEIDDMGMINLKLYRAKDTVFLNPVIYHDLFEKYGIGSNYTADEFPLNKKQFNAGK